jgi:hypothetical protein
MIFLAELTEWCGRRIEREVTQTDRIDFSPWFIPEWKSRTPARRAILIRAAQVWVALGGSRFSTDLGTLSGGP